MMFPSNMKIDTRGNSTVIFYTATLHPTEVPCQLPLSHKWFGNSAINFGGRLYEIV